jgi:O-antigen/teichoic acid export membrane protein
MFRRFREMLARRRNLRAHFWQSAANYSQQAFGLVLGVALARLLTPEIFGEFTYITAVMGVFLLPASWSLSSQIVAEIRVKRDIVTDALHFSRRIVAARFALFVAAVAFLWATRDTQAALLGVVIGLPLVGSEFVQVLRSAAEGARNFQINFYDSVIAGLGMAVLAIPAALFGLGVWALAVPAIPLFVIQLILFSKFTRQSLLPSTPPSGHSYARSAGALWIANVCEATFTKADKLFLGQFSTMSSLGDYNRASNYAPLAARAFNSLLSNAAVASYVHAPSLEARRSILWKSSLLLFVAGSLNFLAFRWLSEPLVPLIFGKQWTSAIPVFEALAPLSLCMAFALVPATLLLADHRYRALASCRVLALGAFLLAAFLWRRDLDAVTMAILFQAGLVLQGFLLTCTFLIPRKATTPQMR